ncbi:MAG: glycerate kinase [Pontimonas sp.]|jgi:glycerate kinase
MKVLLAPDSFKSSLSAQECAAALAEGIRSVDEGCVVMSLPLADGGEGTLDVLVSQGFVRRTVAAVDSHGLPLQASVALGPDVAVIESAQACAFRSGATAAEALSASSAGVGMLIHHALDAGVSEIVLSVGGTSCSDGGVGMLQELGARFTDASGEPLSLGGGALVDLRHVELSGLDPRLGTIRLRLLSDVDNALLGAEGAARVFAPQKGADAEGVKCLEEGFQTLSELIDSDAAHKAGSGAGGGLGYAAIAVLGAVQESGARVIMETVDLEEHVATADLVVTGEGSFDDQSLKGKITGHVLAMAARHNVPSLVVCGVEALATRDVLADYTVISVISLSDFEPDLTRSMANARALLVRAGEAIGNLLPRVVGRALGEI